MQVMPSVEELNSLKLRRRETLLRRAAIFLSLTAAAVMVLLVVQLIHKRMSDDRKVRESAEGEREHYEANVVGTRPAQTEPEPYARPTREIVPNTDVVDMSARFASPRGGRTPAGGAGPGGAEPGRARGAGSAAGGIERIEQKQAAIAEVLREFFEARAVAEMLPLVRDARRVRPLMEEYYRRHPAKDRTWKGIGWAIPVEEPGYRFAYVQATFGDSSPVNVVVEETDQGFLVDWESSVQYSEIGWKEFMATRPGEPKVFRVIASKVETGSGGGDAVLTLKHPQEEGVVLGRFDPADPRFRPLVEQLDLCKWKDVPVILRLCYPGPAAGGGDEVQIAGVEGKGWLILGDRSRG